MHRGCHRSQSHRVSECVRFAYERGEPTHLRLHDGVPSPAAPGPPSAIQDSELPNSIAGLHKEDEKNDQVAMIRVNVCRLPVCGDRKKQPCDAARTRTCTTRVICTYLPPSHHVSFPLRVSSHRLGPGRPSDTGPWSPSQLQVQRCTSSTSSTPACLPVSRLTNLISP